MSSRAGGVVGKQVRGGGRPSGFQVLESVFAGKYNQCAAQITEIYNLSSERILVTVAYF